MKTNVLFIAVLALFAAACGQNADPKENQQNQVSEAKYECPMGCTDQVFDKPGKCPECEMDLVKK